MTELAFVRSKHIVGRKIGGEYVLVPIVSHGADLDSIFTLNRVATFIWEQLNGEATGTEIILALTKQFEVDEAEAARDYCTFLGQLQSIRAIEQAE